MKNDFLMNVVTSVKNSKKNYEIILSKDNFNHLCSNCPEVDRLAGYADDGRIFYLFPDPLGEVSSCFKRMPFGGEYYLYIGAEVPLLPAEATKEEFERLSQKAYSNLEKVINDAKNIPIEEETILGKINLGYVSLKLG